MKTRGRSEACPFCKKDHGMTVKHALRVQGRTPGLLAEAFRGMSDARSLRRPKPRKWSMREILVHLRDCEIHYGARIRKMIAEEGGALVPFDQDKWADGLQYRRENNRLALEGFTALRRANLALLKRLGPRVLERHGIHPEYGRLSVRQIAIHWAAHDENHLGQIRALRDRFGGARRYRRGIAASTVQ